MTLTRRNFITSSGAIAAGAAIAVPLANMAIPGVGHAAAPKAGAQVPGLYRFTVGEFEVTAILDGYLNTDSELISGYEETEARAAHRTVRRPFTSTEMKIAVNGYVVNTGEKLLVIDCGTADFLGPTAGRFHDGLTGAGYRPSQIDAVLTTHLHLDHVGGLSTKEGEALFPDAELISNKSEWDFWHDDGARAQAPDAVKGFFDIARMMVRPYQKRITMTEPGKEIVPGIEAISMPGHTPGHMGFLLTSGNESLLIWGDLLHFPQLQFAQPDWSVAFDVDQELARQTRAGLLDRAAADETPVLGMHLDFPGLGHVIRENGNYRYLQTPWQYQL
ncbi:MBL fold metallo-hydrolase [Hoeflea sp. TYP-13]|uniref:MBL fold metallo-hydrolase n=1 Tax=Hoeflea sp. TYP-13 TaxID=3230023 RepID=UPI0034C66B5D